jgi:hypothetical protein
MYQKNEYIKQVKERVDVKRGTKATKHIIFKMPGDEIADDTQHDHEFSHPTLHATLIHLSPSHYEGVFRIHYRLDVFVKHLSKTEFGMGNFVSFPIKIRSLPFKMPLLG